MIMRYNESTPKGPFYTRRCLSFGDPLLVSWSSGLEELDRRKWSRWKIAVLEQI
ncbi:hypothetical protein GCM10007867_32520 [Gluconobacter cerinus]|uniref:Transposase n=1 Tax=Gluconobacter cerinus TaxID=38307 RepID=A0AAV5NIX5_9PROT|nr:hypothetical protein GCM10007867_32520 [Gluconobacter cerinus]